ncbi:hypothetical protein K0B96_13390 [Horticoccus luteus]|uniref:Uncharacterized protein n=1 Tax=Horticoccus luteus TaxID=2862869 RepID=A0A8F9TV12_9BACT|nr:hypothetical protein [Horticoccus luteus]QYM78288.1 hypothetical protein K0B96_13390 [Horticoccus luteus]
MRLASFTPAVVAVLLGGALSARASTDFSARNERFQPGGGVMITTEKPRAATPGKILHAVPPRIVPDVTKASEGPSFRHVTITSAAGPVRWDVFRVTAEPATMNAWNHRKTNLPQATQVTEPRIAERYQSGVAQAVPVHAPGQPKIERTPNVPLNRFSADSDHAEANSRTVTKPAAAPVAGAAPQ